MCLAVDYPPPSVTQAILAVQEPEAVAWRAQVTTYYRALKDKGICHTIKNIKEYMK